MRLYMFNGTYFGSVRVVVCSGDFVETSVIYKGFASKIPDVLMAAQVVSVHAAGLCSLDLLVSENDPVVQALICAREQGEVSSN